MVKADNISSVFDGDKARFHPHLMRKATPEEKWDIRLWIQVLTISLSFSCAHPTLTDFNDRELVRQRVPTPRGCYINRLCSD